MKRKRDNVEMGNRDNHEYAVRLLTFPKPSCDVLFSG